MVVASSWSSSSRQILWNDCLPGVEQWGYEKSAVADRSRCKYRADPCLASAQYHLRCTLAHKWYNAYCVHTYVDIKYVVNRTRAERWSCKYSAIGALNYDDVVHIICRPSGTLYCAVHIVNSTYSEQTDGGTTKLCADLCVQLKSLLIAQYCICKLDIHCIEFWVTNISKVRWTVKSFFFGRTAPSCSTALITLCAQIVQYNATLILVHVELILCNVLYFSSIAHRK